MSTDFRYGDARRFGLRGDGSDETAALANALRSSYRIGTTVCRVQAGRYAYRTISIPAGVTLAGAGIGQTIFRRIAASHVPSEGDVRLFGIRLIGSRAKLLDCTCVGLWDPAHPHLRTWDVNVALVGDGVSDTIIERVESRASHIGFLIGGIVGSSEASFGAQNNNTLRACVARDTCDLGFGLVGRDRTATGMCAGTKVINCLQDRSAESAGAEVRFQREVTIQDFSGANNRHESLGAALRLEECEGVTAVAIQSRASAMGVQVINDTHDCSVEGLAVRGGTFGVWCRHCARIQLRRLSIDGCAGHGVILAYQDGLRWRANNEDVTIDTGSISNVGRSQVSSGITVIGSGYQGQALADNGLRLTIKNLLISGASGSGITISAGGNFQITNCVISNNGRAGDASTAGVRITSPQPGGVRLPSRPAGGIIRGLTFERSERQSIAVLDQTGNGTPLTKLVNIVVK